MHPFARATVAALLPCALVAQASWTRLYPSSAPAPRYDAGMAFDSVRGQVVLFGGDAPLVPPANDLWAWTGTQWTQLNTPFAPSGRDRFGFASDTIRGRIVLFGGAYVSPAETWEWTGAQWLLRAPALSPSACSDFGMAFDSRRGRCVLFGGADVSSGAFLRDTWEWDGSNWLQRQPATAPLARRNGQLAFDEARGVCVLFGGAIGQPNAAQFVNDTWTWDGTDWQLRFPAHYPRPSYGHRLAYDAARARVVGRGFGDSSIDPFAWEWDGQDWRLVLQASPGPQAHMPMAYDPIRRQVVAYGSEWQPYANHGDTWVYATSAPATVGSYGSGCGGSAGVPVLANEAHSLPWLGDTFRTRASNLAASTSAVVFATGLAAEPPLDLTPFGMPGCSRWLGIVAVEFAPAAAGAATWSLAIPSSTVFAGMHLHQQVFALEAGANAAGVITTNAVECVVGIR